MLTAMTTANFVFLISMSIEPEIWEYKGHFLDCNQAMIWKEKNYPDAPATKCMLEKYIVMPKNIAPRTIDIRDKNGKRFK
jgi:hypothetical protein|tara:strand:+ start:365 stop:604 length:240 start_codon:yes stop_codon:yes gene_type:complete